MPGAKKREKEQLAHRPACQLSLASGFPLTPYSETPAGIGLNSSFLWTLRNSARAREGREGKERKRKRTESQWSPGPGEVGSGTHPCLPADPDKDKSPIGLIPQCGAGEGLARRKSGKGYKQVFHGKATQRPKNHRRGYLDSTGVRKMKAKAMMSYSCLPIRSTSIN